MERPTFRPSMLVTYAEHLPKHPARRCHSFVTDGEIHYLGDCTHDLANQEVDIPDW